ncbi:MAG: NAD(P)H-hydrate epimerase, partial [Chitinophagales bacterium]
MKIFNVEQIRAADNYTIQQEPILSHELMERASEAFVNWFVQQTTYSRNQTIHIFCGIGNNGGDGLCIARILYEMHYPVKVHILRFSSKSSNDFQINEERLAEIEEVTIKNLYDV